LTELPATGPLPAGAILPLRSHAQWLLAAWGPSFGKYAGAPSLHVHTRNDVARMRMEAAAVPYGTKEEMEEEVPVVSDNRGMPGQISLFDAVKPDPLRERKTADLHEAARRLAWRSDFPILAVVPAKMTVTALKRLWEERDEESAQLEDAFRLACMVPASRTADGGTVSSDAAQNAADDGTRIAAAGVLPVFMTGKREDEHAMRYGTLMHLVLQHLEPCGGMTPDVEEVIDMLVKRGLIAEADRRLPNRASLHAFLNSSLFARMKTAGRIHRETPFTVRMAAGDVLGDPSIPASETVVLQGIVDCWFEEEGRIVLVDYKTDRTRQRVPEYRRQLSWYAAALEKVVGMPVKETILWFLREAQMV